MTKTFAAKKEFFSKKGCRPFSREDRIELSSSPASVTALVLGVLCIYVRGVCALFLSPQEREPRSPTDEWCSAAVVMATAEQKKEGEEKGGY